MRSFTSFQKCDMENRLHVAGILLLISKAGCQNDEKQRRLSSRKKEEMKEAFWRRCIADVKIRRILVLCKTHLDIGFTDFAGKVREQYLNNYIPEVIQTARQLESEHTGENLVWNTGSYILYEYWRQTRGRARRECEAALADGILAYHALPFTVHSELFDSSLFAALLQDCRELDAAFGRRTLAAKMTDVPGHCRGIVPLLRGGGVQFLHFGINAASYAPELPQLFRWQVDGSEIVVMFAGNGYGTDMNLPDGMTRVVFLHGGDNKSPPGVGMVRQFFREMRLQYPNAAVSMVSLNDLADTILPFRDSLPVVKSEIGDSWIHGIASDYVKTARFRELLRFRKKLKPAEVPRSFDRNLALVGEHTWGLDIKSHLGDDVHWSREELDELRKTQPNFIKVEESWKEQRNYLDAALQALPVEKQREAAADLAALTPVPWDFSHGKKQIPEVKTERFHAKFDPCGNLVHLIDPAGKYSYGIDGEALLQVNYHTYGSKEMLRYLREYCPWDGTVEQVGWAAWDFGKIGLPEESASGVFPPGNARFVHDDTDTERNIVRVCLQWPEPLSRQTGAPSRLEVEYAFHRHDAQLDITLQWFGKSADRKPEAIIAHFKIGSADSEWRMGKLGCRIDPAQVVYGGGTGIHAVDSESSLRIRKADNVLILDSMDAPLFLPDDRELWHYDPNPAQPAGRFGFCLMNNQWGTNFPQWNGDDFRCRFRFRWKKD